MSKATKANIQDIKSDTPNKSHINVEAPPPPYEAAGGATTLTFSNDNSNVPLRQQQQDGSTVIYIDNSPRDQPYQYSNKKERTCLEKYWKPVINPDSWKCAFYFLFIAPIIALFAHTWCLVLFFHAIISLIFPPIGFFFCVGTAWSFRALGRLELIAATMCTKKHKPAHVYPPVFRTSSYVQDEGMLRRGIKICTDKYTWMCFAYFVFINILYVTFTWGVVLALFILAFSPLMIVAMPLMCAVCLKFGIWKVKMSEALLI